MAVLLGLGLSALLLALTLPVLRYVLFCLRVRRLTQHNPGPNTIPIFGSLLTIIGPHKDLFKRVEALVQGFPTGFTTWVGPLPCVVVTQPDDLEVVFTSPHTSDKCEFAYDALKPIIGCGLINMNGPNYRRHRKAITTSLHLDILQDFIHVFAENGRRLATDTLEALANSGEVFDCTPLMGRCAAHTVCETVLSTDVVDMEDEWDTFVSVSHNASQLMLIRAIQPWFRTESLFRFSTHYKEYKQLSAGMTGFVSKVLDRKIQQIKSGKVPKRRRQAFLDHVLRSDEGAVLTKEELFDELKTLLFAASSTSMDFMSLFLVCMSLLPDIQREVQKEQDDIFGDERERAVLPSDLPHMQYLERVLKEVLRFFPPVSIFARNANEDAKLPSGIVVPRGAVIVILPYQTHRDERHFADPSKFDPDRFLPENTRGRHPFAYIPFSAGGRNCIGQRYALMFAKTVASCILRRFTVLPVPGGPRTLDEVHLLPGISLAIHGGARVRLQHREPTQPPPVLEKPHFVSSFLATPLDPAKTIS